jgi:hypothetical protein
MKCPHCSTDFHESWKEYNLSGADGHRLIGRFLDEPVTWHFRNTVCSKCKDAIIEIAPFDVKGLSEQLLDWRMIYPIAANRGPVHSDVPYEIANDYIEACNVLPISAKASAALSRRCLQSVLHNAGYNARDLAAEIDLVLNEPDPKKAIPERLRSTIDAVRNFGNFSAHPINDKTALQIIEVEPHEAEWCLEILEECFEHFYVGPALAKARKDALNARLAAAGKPPSK